MFNKNVFTQKDPIADIAQTMLEAETKAKMEELKGQQHKIDKNKNNKIDAHDFAILRGEKKAVKEDAEQVEENAFDWKKPREPEVKGGSGVKKGRAYGGAAQKSKPEQDDADEKKMKKEEVEQVDEASYSAKAARAGKDIGKPGKMFGVIAKKAAARYGSAASGKRVAGALLAKLRKEETDFEPALIDQILEDTIVEIDQLDEEVKNSIFAFLENVIESADEVEQLDELKTDTVHSYYKKAFAQKYAHKLGTGEKPSKETLRKRNQGMDRASKRFADKNPTKGAGTPASAGDWYKQGRYMGDSVEVNSENQLDERSLSAGETAEKERIVKGMKKNLAGFKKRYGEKAKSVMYATATKAAKKD